MARALRAWPATVGLFALVAFLPGLTEGEGPTWPAVVAAAVSCGVLPLCRRFPATAFVVATAGTLASIYVTKLVFPAGAPVLVALYSIGARLSVRVSTMCTLVAVIAVFTQVQLVRHIPPFTLRNGTQLGWFVAATAIGVAVQSQRKFREMAEERARKAEQSREAEARRRVDEERLRIAQELHDVIGHSIAVINVQAGVAVHLVHKDPATTEKSLEMIRTTSATALEEIRTTLGLLRAAEDEAPPRGPVPGLGEIPDLIERARAAGLTIEHVRRGDVRPLPTVVGTTVYRLVQETLTNALKHSGVGTGVLVSMDFLDHELRVSVEDDGRGTGGSGGGSGLGLRGMRERVEAAGGGLRVDRLSPGFRVTARIPTEAS
ncbi:histidine kinase [Streptomyces sp. NPDC045431]|uniref:sensor histidine kinase n=1 Tax=Streptomyces sp. NPDC045431 TaxID=3155613 RepID=UPI0033D4215B